MNTNEENAPTEDTEGHRLTGALNDPTAPKSASGRLDPVAVSDEDDVEGHVYIEPKGDGTTPTRGI